MAAQSCRASVVVSRDCPDCRRRSERIACPMIDPNVKAQLASYRQSIDNIDAALVHMLAERFRCTKEVGVLKAKYNLPPADPAREEYQIERLRQLAKAANLDPDFAEKFLNFVIKEVIRHHEQIAADHAEQSAAAR
ncbi:chorismate mutase [Rhizobium leguminosarum]|uniref:chorismate mutase n=18 Tax=Rhizobium TaxID=379 RepID=A0A7Z0IYS9_RHILE|nr:chorismate mutase [Rhizobium leguminosarum]